VVFLAVAAGVLWSVWRGQLRLRPPPRDWRLLGLLALWVYFFFTTQTAMAAWAAVPRFLEVTKVLLPLVLTLLLVDDRRKLDYLLITIAFAIALATIKGGYWAVMTGFGDRVYGPPGSAFYGNNHFAVLVVMNIPLLMLWLRRTAHRQLRYLIMAAIALSVAAALSSWSRGALIALVTTIVLLLWHSRRRYLAAALVAGAVGLTFATLPEQWFERMETISSHEQDKSAQIRLDVWERGFRYARVRPFTGAGFEGWQHVADGTDWHSIYVEMMAEHGLVAFALWLTLLISTLINLSQLSRRSARSPQLSWIHDHSAMLRASLVAYAVGGVFIGITYWELPYHLVVIAVLLSRFAQSESPLTRPHRPPLEESKTGSERGSSQQLGSRGSPSVLSRLGASRGHRSSVARALVRGNGCQ
jgi:probable O-glycosylation ligase (exosortase A-associated)